MESQNWKVSDNGNNFLTFEITAILATASSILNHIPKSCARSAIGLRVSHISLFESIRISKILFASAKNGAKGKAATKMVMKPNWITERENKKLTLILTLILPLLTLILILTDTDINWILILLFSFKGISFMTYFSL